MRRPPDVLIVARSGRALAQAARAAGHLPLVVDLFGDVDTHALAHSVAQVAATADGNFVADALLATLNRIFAQQGRLPLVCGSGFERAPALLATIAGRYAIGNSLATAYTRLLDPPALWRRLHSRGLAVPTTQWRRPVRSAGWLAKRAGASGGAHVHALAGPLPVGDYVQRRISGRSVSALLLSNGRQTRLCGIAEHLCWHPAADHWRYEGALSLMPIPRAVAAAARAAGHAVAAELKLCGGFGLDFILRADGQLMLVDINPRLPATLDLYADRGAIFASHLHACATGKLLYSSSRRGRCRGHLLLYAEGSWEVPATLRWPVGVADRPRAGTLIARGEPLCTLLAAGATPTAVVAQLAAGDRRLRRALGGAADTVLPTAINIRTRGGIRHVAA